MRERLPGELIPISAELSSAKEEEHAAANAIDLNLDTAAWTNLRVPPRDTIWLKVRLASTSCIQQLVWYKDDGSPRTTWDCTKTDCSACTSIYADCRYSNLTVSISDGKETSDPKCKLGDTVQIDEAERVGLWVYEFAIIGKQE